MDRDIKQAVLARRLKVTIATYSRYETEEIKPPVEVFIELAKYYDVSLYYILGISDEKRAYNS